MKTKIRLWLFNRAAQLFEDRLTDVNSLFRRYRSAGFASRPEATRAPGAHPLDIMSSGRGRDEYFVPIPYKCLGGLIESESSKWPGLFAGIKNYYEEAGRPLRSYWEGEGYFGARMYSPEYKGYYDMIRTNTEEQASRGIEQKNILIGYSQGGLVARYLAFVDEHAMRRETGEGYVHGLLTIAAPNLGSPLANEKNKWNIARAVQQLKLSAFGLRDGTDMPFRRLEAELTGQPALEALWRNFDTGLDALIKDCETILTANPPPARPDRMRDIASLKAVLDDVYKWTSGLRDASKNTAFFDLNILRLSEPGADHSSLRLMHENPLKRIPHAAILSGDGDPENFLHDALPAFWDLAYLRIKQTRILDVKFEDILKDMGDIYRALTLQEHLSPDAAEHPAIARARREYRQGFRDSRASRKPAVSKMQHDFVIPSSYQVFQEAGDNFLGNWYNPATHLSGGDRSFRDGMRNYRLALRLLRRIEARL